MKKILVGLLICLLLTGGTACALTDEEAHERVQSYLTEVFSYTAEEAEHFTATAEWEKDHWLIRFASSVYPEWVYTATWKEDDVHIQNVTSPFKSEPVFSGYPGEGGVREGLNRARKNGWFVLWNKESRLALADFMSKWGIEPTQKLTEGLSLGTIPAGNALHEYFLSCYGPEEGWTPELRQWHDWELQSYDLVITEEPPVGPGVVTYQNAPLSGSKVECTRFIGEAPEALAQAFANSNLEGWSCLCGAIMQNIENRYGYGLAVFEKEGERLLVGLKHEATDEVDWELSPISKQALYTDREMYIIPGSVRTATIVYPSSETETERFEVTLSTTNDNRVDAFIQRYVRMDEATGNGVSFAIDNGIEAASYENHQLVGTEGGPLTFASAMSLLDIETFPTTVEEWKNAETLAFPQGYGLCRGVHLRRRTSSRSRDLGEYQPGVLVKILGVEPGDPDPWYHVQVGRAEGYMSSVYVDEAATRDTSLALNRPLMIAQANEPIKLKKGASVLAGTVQKLEAGTQMQVLAECGDWLHVNLPQGEMSGQMDANGTDGYVKRDQVTVAGTQLVLEWKQNQ